MDASIELCATDSESEYTYQQSAGMQYHDDASNCGKCAVYTGTVNLYTDTAYTHTQS